jgi:hypothetical protein
MKKLSIDEIKVRPLELSEMIASIKNGIISGKFTKESTLLTKLCFGCYAFWSNNIFKSSLFSRKRKSVVSRFIEKKEEYLHA